MGKPTVSIVLPNWNGVYLLEKHLQKTIDASKGAEIIVADDCSTDGSVEFLEKKFPNVVIVANKKRNGFAVNINSGVAKATGDIVVLVNTDVEPEVGYLEPLIEHFSDKNVFAVGCMEKSQEKGGVVLRGRGVARWEKGFYVHERGEVNQTDTAWVSGGSGAFRHSMWNILGGMDILYTPFYWEDIDLSYRARKIGWKIIFEPKSIVDHYHEEGKIKREFSPIDVKRIVYRNQFTFIWKNVSHPAIFFTHIVWLPVRLIQAFMRGDIVMFQGFLLALTRLPQILKKRCSQSKLWKINDTAL